MSVSTIRTIIEKVAPVKMLTAVAPAVAVCRRTASIVPLPAARIYALLMLSMVLLAMLSTRPRAEAQPSLSTGAEKVKMQLLIDREVLHAPVEDGAPAARVGVRLSIAKGWHIYWLNSGEAAIPTEVKWQLPANWGISKPQWPVPQRFLERGNITTFGYENEVVLLFELDAPREVTRKTVELDLTATASFLVCSDICVPGTVSATRHIRYGGPEPERVTDESRVLKDWMQKVPVPVGDAQSLFELPDLELEAFPVKVGERKYPNFVVLRISGLKGSYQEPATLLQFFPLRGPGIDSAAAGVFTEQPVTTEPALPAAKSSGVSFLVPLRDPVGGEFSKEDTPSGVLALSPRLTATEHPVALQWKYAPGATRVVTSPIALDPNTGKVVGTTLAFLRHDSAKAAVAPSVITDLSGGQKANEARAQSSLGWELLFAFLAGLILNLMPCVLPVVSLKALSLVEISHGERRSAVPLALSYALGVMFSFLVLAVISIALRTTGETFHWGFQFQYPGFVFGLTVVVFLAALGFFDWFHVQLGFTQKLNAAANESRHPYIKQFLEGILATALSTPCLGPFLGGTVVFALSASAPVVLLVFTTIALGLASPYILIACVPTLANFLPKPGQWMVVFKEGMGLLLLGTVIFLLACLQSLNSSGGIATLVVLLGIFTLVWAWRQLRLSTYSASVKSGLPAALLAALVAFTVWVWPSIAVEPRALTGPDSDGPSALALWRPWSEEDVQAELEAGRPVFVDFTAAWCVTCKANEWLVLKTNFATNVFRKHGVATFVADFTDGNEAVAAALKRYGGVGLPYYVVIRDKNSPPVVLPTLLTKGSFQTALEEALAGTSKEPSNLILGAPYE